MGRTVGNYRLFNLEGGTERFFGLDRKPTLVSFFYTGCSEGCPLVLNNIAGVLGKLPKELRDDVAVVSISIDPAHDTPAVLAGYSKPFVKEFKNWRFATATEETIRMLTSDLGFAYEKKEDGSMEHLNRVTLINSSGLVLKHFYGTDVKAEDVAGALKDIARGRTLSSGLASVFDKALIFCSKYDPVTKRYVTDVGYLMEVAIQWLFALGVAAFLMSPMFWDTFGLSKRRAEKKTAR
ncbi:MAG: SCO family protein [Nitrospinae bacterium]|nr:SCO family protein [Nitrospinota bacterium]